MQSRIRLLNKSKSNSYSELLLSGKTLKKQKQIARLLIISGRALFYTMTSPLSQKAMAVEVHR